MKYIYILLTFMVFSSSVYAIDLIEDGRKITKTTGNYDINKLFLVMTISEQSNKSKLNKINITQNRLLDKTKTQQVNFITEKEWFFSQKPHKILKDDIFLSEAKINIIHSDKKESTISGEIILNKVVDFKEQIVSINMIPENELMFLYSSFTIEDLKFNHKNKELEKDAKQMKKILIPVFKTEKIKINEKSIPKNGLTFNVETNEKDVLSVLFKIDKI